MVYLVATNLEVFRCMLWPFLSGDNAQKDLFNAHSKDLQIVWISWLIPWLRKCKQELQHSLPGAENLCLILIFLFPE